MQKSLLKQKFEEFKISEEEGLDKGYEKMQKILTQMNTLKIKPEPEDVNMKFLRGLPPSWSDQHLVYEDLDQMNKEEFEEYDQKHQMAMLSIKVHRFEKKHRRKIKFNGRENARFDKKLVKCFNCKKMGHFSRECRAQSGKNSSNYQKYKSKEAGKDESDSKAMVVVDGSIDWDKQTKAGNTKPRSLENFGMIAGIKIESDADSEGEVVSANDAIPTGVYVSTGNVSADVVSPQSETEFAFMGLSTEVSIPVTCPLCCDSKYKLIEKVYQGQREQLNDCVVDLKAHKNDVKILEKQIKCHQKNQLDYEEKIRVFLYTLKEKSNILEYRQKLIDQAAQEKQELMTKLDNEISNQAKWNNSGKNLYKLINSSMSVRTKRGLGLDKYIREGELCIDDSKFSIFHTNSDELEGQPIYNRECQAQGGQNRNNYQKYKEAGKDGTDSKAMVVVDGSVDWDKQTKEGNTEPRSLENFGMLAGIKLESDADSEGEEVSADDVIPAVVFVSTDPVAAPAAVFVSIGPVVVVAAADSPHSETEFAFMGLSTEAHKHAVKSLEKQIKCHQTNQLAYEEKIKVLSYEIEEKSNILEYRQKLIDQAT
nr:hypothetical protein [Tanacetum cinerariifolium]